ncbi:MAG: methyltransferase protein [Fibrobacteres bacterium]|nr:methyltransferase protein [Fibrobacterota bacterium]
MTFHSLRFDRAAATYGAHSQVQERMADALIGMLPSSGTDLPSASIAATADPDAILELGCGTGNFSRRLRARFPRAVLSATDAAPRMLAAAQENLRDLPGIHWSLFDASGEAPPVASGPFGLAASNALVQWFPDLRPHFSLIGSLLIPSGGYLVSGFSRDNFPELNAILEEPPFEYPDYPGHAKAEIASAAEAAGFTVEAYREEAYGTVQPSPRAFLDSIRGLGSARRPEEERPLTRARLRLLLDTYQERYACAGGVKATWKPWYAWLRKTP